MWVSFGGFRESIPNVANKFYNSHVIVDNTGSIASVYRKIHLFDVHIPEQAIKLQESEYVQAGTELVVIDKPNPLQVPIGMSICYDVRFPEMYAQLRHKYGAQCLLVPSAFTQFTGEAHWHLLLRARAVETQCFVIAAAQTGQHSEKRQSYGHSLVVHPFGNVLLDIPSDQTNCIGIVELDMTDVESVRKKMPIAQHRRAHLYK